MWCACCRRSIVGEREIDEALDIMHKVAREWPA